MRLAIDVMGGDNAPDAIIKGCVEALTLLDRDDQLLLIGDQATISDVLTELDIDDSRLVIIHASQAIAMDDSPAKAVRAKPDSSIVQAALRGSKKHEDPVDCVLSAGNTGACVAASIMHMKRLPGVHRPGIAVTIPAFKGPVVLCDAGANPEPTHIHLWQYGVMADTYAKVVLGIDSPRVALMNIGAEEAKGSDLVRKTRDLLRETPDLNFIGYVEGRDLFDGVADVIITDGFVGNTLLKMAEGMARSIFTAIAHEVLQSDPALAMQLEPIFKAIYAKNDYHEYGGAPLLGVNGSFFISHGSSQARTIRSAIRTCREYVLKHVNDDIASRIKAIEHLSHPERELA